MTLIIILAGMGITLATVCLIVGFYLSVEVYMPPEDMP